MATKTSDFQTRFPVINRERGTVSAKAPRNSGASSSNSTETIQFLKLAMSRYQTSADAESEMRREQEIDQRFMANEQWPDNIRQERFLDGRPCLTINRLPSFKRQITNQQRAAKPSIQINPIDSQRDTKTAEVYQGIIRHIESASAADVAYDMACDHQVTIGRGYVRIVIEWDDLDPWVQVIRIRRVKNPFLVFFDPACQEHDYSDARYAFVIDDMPTEEFRDRYGATALTNSQGFDVTPDRSSDWAPEGKIRVAEYFYVEVKEEKVVLLSNGEEFPKSALDDEEMQMFLQDAGVVVTRERTVERRTVKWAKITANAILEEGEWPGRWIPIVPVIGDELDINGKVDLRGMVRDARDPQRMYNYWASAETEAIALAPKSPVVAAEGQLEGDYLKDWKLANRRNIPVLLYKPKTLANILVPPPTRQVVEPPIQAIAMAIRQADNDLKAVTGLYDASLGERGPEESAKAILSRQRQGEISNSHWVDNLIRAMRSLGRQIVDLIPRVYDVPRVMRIIGADNQPKTVMVHAGQDNAPSADSDAMEGIQGVYDLSAGRYDVTATVGPTYQSRRQESVEAMNAFIKAFPQAAPVIGDVMAENMDWPGASIVAKRLRKMVPPQVLEEDDPQMLQAKLTQSEQQMQAMQAELMELKMQAEAQTIQAQSRERIAQMQLEGQMQLKQMEVQTAGEIERSKAMAQAQGEQIKGQAKLQVEAQTAQLKIEAAGRTEEAKARGGMITKMADAEHETRENARQRVHESIENQKDRDLDVTLKTMDHLIKKDTQADQNKATEKQLKQKTEGDIKKAKVVAKSKPKPVAAKKSK